MQFVRLKNWEQYQHYKDRSPPWIKLYQDLITSRMWVTCDDASRTLAVACMLLAAKTDNRIPLDPVYLRRVAYLNGAPDFSKLVDTDFLEIVDEKGVASTVLADCYQVASTEERRGEKRQRRGETEKKVAALPDWVPLEPWNSWLEVRRQNRAPNTPRALHLAITELAKLKASGQDIQAVLEQSTLRGWRGVFAIKGDKSIPDYSAVMEKIRD